VDQQVKTTRRKLRMGISGAGRRSSTRTWVAGEEGAEFSLVQFSISWRPSSLWLLDDLRTVWVILVLIMAISFCLLPLLFCPYHTQPTYQERIKQRISEKRINFSTEFCFPAHFAR
jgi:hypothetical protein